MQIMTASLPLQDATSAADKGPGEKHALVLRTMSPSSESSGSQTCTIVVTLRHFIRMSAKGADHRNNRSCQTRDKAACNTP